MSSKNKNLNVGQMPNPPEIQKQISEALQERNLGVDKILLNVNGGNSELVTNKNSILKLKAPFLKELFL